MNPRGNFFQDERLDRGVTWLLALLVTMSLSIGAWFFSGLTKELQNLNSAVSTLNVRIGIMETHSKSMEAHLSYRLERVEKDLDALKKRFNDLKAASK